MSAFRSIALVIFEVEGAVSPSTFFFFNDPATTEIYTLSLHDALPISERGREPGFRADVPIPGDAERRHAGLQERSEEHTSELQSRLHLVCRLLLEKKSRSRD